MTGLSHWVGRWLQKHQERQYLHRLTDLELKDAGLSRADFMTALAAPADTRQRMLSMAAAYGLPGVALDNEHWRALDIARACGQCGERAKCRRWLTGLEQNYDPATFCPNAEHYKELAVSFGVRHAARARRRITPIQKKLWHI